MSSRPRLLLFSPVPPTRSGISDYTVELLPYLREYWDIYVVISDDAEDPSSGDELPQIVRNSELQKSRLRYAPRFYHMGNNVHHEYIHAALQDVPGVTLMHDFCMHHLLTDLLLARGNAEGYKYLLAHQYGASGAAIADYRRDFCYHDMAQFMYAMNASVVEKSAGILVHSRASLNELNFSFPAVAAERVPFPHVQSRAHVSYRAQPGRDRQDDDPVVISSFGFVTPPKQIELVLRALAIVRESFSRFRYCIVGEVSDSVPVYDLLQELQLEDHVGVTGYVDMNEFHRYMELSDAVISLRYPSAGETSAALVRAMGFGKANLVFDYASYADFPDEVVFKVPLDTSSPEQLACRIRQLLVDDGLRERISANAVEYLREQHDPACSALQMTRFIRASYGMNTHVG